MSEYLWSPGLSPELHSTDLYAESPLQDPVAARKILSRLGRSYCKLLHLENRSCRRPRSHCCKSGQKTVCKGNSRSSWNCWSALIIFRGWIHEEALWYLHDLTVPPGAGHSPAMHSLSSNVSHRYMSVFSSDGGATREKNSLLCPSANCRIQQFRSSHWLN